MADQTSKLPVESDDVTAGILAALARIESVPTTKNMIDLMPDEEWLSVAPDNWKIEAGSSEFADEIDDVDAEVMSAA